MGCYVFSICTVDFQEEETYEFIGPHGMVMASAVRTRFNPRTEIRVCANTAKSDNPVEVMCQAGFFFLCSFGHSENTAFWRQPSILCIEILHAFSPQSSQACITCGLKRLLSRTVNSAIFVCFFCLPIAHCPHLQETPGIDRCPGGRCWGAGTK